MKIVYTTEDGKTAIVTPAKKEHLARSNGFEAVLNMSDQEYMEFLVKIDVPETARDVRIVSDEEAEAIRRLR